jgi:hypothetical protein
MSDSTIGLMFEIAADPSKAVAATQNFRDQGGAALRDFENQMVSTMTRSQGLGNEFAGVLGNVTGRMKEMHQAAALQIGNESTGLRGVSKAAKDATEQFRQMGQHGALSFSQLASSVKGWGGVTVSVVEQVIASLLQESATERLSVATHAQSEAQKTETTLLNITKKAAIKAGEQYAEALSSWPDFPAMAAHFAAAAAWTALAAAPVAAMAASAMGGSGGVSKSSVEASAASASATAAPALAAGASGTQAPGGHVTVMVVGESRAAQWMAGVLNKGVQYNSVRLMASHTLRPAPAVRSG